MNVKLATLAGFLSFTLLLLPVSVSDTAPQTVKTIHMYVALCDNIHQGIVPVKSSLGNGDDPGRNLYWGACYGVKSYFDKSREWQLLKTQKNPKKQVLERCVFRYRQEEVYLVADAYRGRAIRESIENFLQSASGITREAITLDQGTGHKKIPCAGEAELIVFVGHNGLMDFDLKVFPAGEKNNRRKVIILACKSKPFFKIPVASTAAYPLLWTTGLMAPEAYTLKAAIDGWIAGESHESIRQRALKAYHLYQGCGIKAAARLFVSGW